MKILLVGLGQLGSRYLQGFLAIKERSHIDIIEPNNDAYANGVFVSGVTNSQNITHRRVGIESCDRTYDLVVIATSSAPRVKLVDAVRARVSSRAWILEKMLAQSLSDLEQISMLLDGEQVWVNTPRRISSLYVALRSLIKGERLMFTVRWPRLGLGCNAIHFIDAVEYLSGESIERVEINASSGWYESKRAGYLDFDGAMVATYSNGSKLQILTDFSGTTNIICETNETSIVVDEVRGELKLRDRNVAGRVELQSEMSGHLAERAIKVGNNDFLPTLETSVTQHKVFFAGLSKNATLNIIEDEIWPIT